MGKRIDIKLMDRCEARCCQAKAACLRHSGDYHHTQGLADFSQAPDFKPGNSAETCRHFIRVDRAA